MEDLRERRILITGAAGGLGSELCRMMIADGAHVLATDISAEKGMALRANVPDGPGQLDYVLLDQSDVSAIDATLPELAARHGPIDSLVNNAAMYPLSAAESVSRDEFAMVQQVNLFASTAFMQAVVPEMKRAGFGRIINVASITFDIGVRDLSAYVASKGALIGLTKVWAREFGPFGITANAISPGAFQTDAERIHPDPENYGRFVLEQQAIKRRGNPSDFAYLARFLLSEKASFITGQTIRVDGGWVMA